MKQATERGLRGREVNASRFKTTRPSPLWFESMRGSCQLLTKGCWFTPRKNLFLQLWKLTNIYNQTLLKNGVKDQFTSPHLCQLNRQTSYKQLYPLLIIGNQLEIIKKWNRLNEGTVDYQSVEGFKTALLKC